MKKFKGKGIYITGGSSGIGLEVGKLFVSYGADLVLIARNVEKLQTAKKLLEDCRLEESQTISTISVDVSNHNDVYEKMQQAVNDFGTPDILINSAGINKYADHFENITYDMLYQFCFPPLLLRLLNHPSLPVYHLPLLLLLRPPPFLRSLYHHFLMKWLLILEQGSLRHGGQGTGWLGGDRLELHVDLLPLEPHLLLDEQLLLVQLLLVEHLDALIIVLLHPWLFRLGFHLEVAHTLLHLQLVAPVLPLGSGQELAQFARLDTSLVWLSSEHIIIDIIIMDS